MFRIFNFITLTLLATFPVNAQDWTQWRGPQRDGVATQFNAPANWPEKLKLVWKASVGAGYSSPVASGSKVWIHSRQNEEEVISCLDRTTGKLLWSQRNTAPFKQNQYANEMGRGPFATPVLHQGRLYTLGVNALLSCFDANTGALKWRKDFGVPATSKNFCGTAMSPLIEGRNVIVYVGDDLAGGRLIALDAATGKESWEWKGEGPGYASPIVTEFFGVRQLVTMSDKSVIGINVANGQLLWRFAWPDEWNENIVTPLRYRDLLILSGVRRGTLALRIARANGTPNNEWKPEQVWHKPELTLYMNSPVLAGEHFYGLSSKRKGMLFCAEAATGNVIWQTEGREGTNAALLHTREWLFALTTDANLIVARKNVKGFEQAAKYTVADSATYAHPVLLGEQILIKDNTSLQLWSWR